MRINEVNRNLVNALEDAKAFDDPEGSHIKADKALLEALQALGIPDSTIELYKSIQKWYA